MSTVQTKGFAELQKMLDTLPAKIEQNILRSALRAGAKIVMSDAKSRARSVSGSLRDNLFIRTGAKKGKVVATIKNKRFYAKFVESGTKPHFIGVKGKSLNIGGRFVGKIINHPGAKAKPFFRPALESQTEAAISAIAAQIKKRLTKEGLDASDIDTGAA